MTDVNGRRSHAAMVGLAAVLAVAAPAPAHAADFDVVLPAGLACAFELRITGTGDAPETREFTDSEGNVVKTLTAGRGQALTFTNVATGESVSFKSNGAVTKTTVAEGGSSTVQSTGHNVLIFFPSDVPAGPTTTLYVGRVTYEVTAQGIFTLTGSSGTTRDICAELS